MPEQSKVTFLKCMLVTLMTVLAFGLNWVGLPSTAQEAGSIKIGFLDVNNLFVSFEGTNAAIEEFEQLIVETQTSLQLLRVQLAIGEISEQEFFVLQAELQAELLVLNQQLTNAVTNSILTAAETVGEELGMDLITPLDNVVAHGQSEVTVDLTDAVLNVMNASFADTEFDLNLNIEVQPLQMMGFFTPGEVILNFDGTLDAIQPLRDATTQSETDKADLQKQLDNGSMNEEEFNEAVAQIDNNLQILEQQIIADLISDVSGGISRLGEAVGFDLISVRQNVILFHNPDALVDLTLDTARFMNLELRGEVYNLSRVVLPTVAPQKIGFVDADQIFLDFEGTDTAIEAFREEIAFAQAELARLSTQLENGLITQADFLKRRNEIQTQLAELDQELSLEITNQIVETVTEVGNEQGFDLITPQSNVVLYHNEDTIEDLTQIVLARMNGN